MKSAASTVTVVLRRLAGIEAALPSGEAWLSDSEKTRLAFLTAQKRRQQFIAGHFLARGAMASHAGGLWTGYELSAPELAPPLVTATPAGVDATQLHVSLSHSGDWIACAVSGSAVGVDVERNDRARDFEALNAWLHEQSALNEWPLKTQAGKQQWFYQQWTLKEAWLKWHHGACPGAASPSLQSGVFTEALDGSGDVALTAQTSDLTLAIYPAKFEFLKLHLEAEDPIGWTSWQVDRVR